MTDNDQLRARVQELETAFASCKRFHTDEYHNRIELTAENAKLRQALEDQAAKLIQCSLCGEWDVDNSEVHCGGCSDEAIRDQRERDKLRKALEKIANHPCQQAWDNCIEGSCTGCIARAALAASPEPGEG